MATQFADAATLLARGYDTEIEAPAPRAGKTVTADVWRGMLAVGVAVVLVVGVALLAFEALRFFALVSWFAMMPT